MLTFMTARDREAAMERYEALFASSEDEAQVIASLGSPLRVAVQLSREYEKPEDADEDEEPPAGMQAERVTQPAAVETEQPEGASTQPEPEPEEPAGMDKPAVAESAPEEQEEPVASPVYHSRPGAKAVYVPAAVIVGIPVTLIIAAVMLAIAACGVLFLIGGFCILQVCFWGLIVVADMMLIWGSALILFAAGLLLLWLGIYLFVKAVPGFIGWIIRTGRKFCLREVPVQ